MDNIVDFLRKMGFDVYQGEYTGAEIDTLLGMTSYAAGSEVTQNITTAVKAAEEAAEAAANRAEAAVGDLKSALNAVDCRVDTDLISGNITNAGSITSAKVRIRSQTPVLVAKGMRWHIDGDYQASVAIYRAATFTTSSFVAFVGGSNSAFYTGDIAIPDQYAGMYMGIRIEKIGHIGEDISADVPTIGNYVTLYDPATVLTKSNFYANYGAERSQFLPVRRSSSFTWDFGMTIYGDGREDNSIRSAITKLLPVAGKSAIQNLSPALDHKGREFRVLVAEYINGNFVARYSIASGDIHVTGDGVDGVKLIALYPSTVTAEMTSANLMTNFSVGMVGHIIPGDGQRPKYVAFGASTTVGAVHHYSNESITYTPYAYPDYIGQILGLDTTNLGYGTTGFMARDAGAKPNFMDAIYNNSNILATADLITLTFGYGNDATAGLPFGEWDDYFPYDDVGQFFVPGETAANQAGVTTMLSRGATLMGCLNWCVKWIGDHYPKAALILIWGAPGSNDAYPISVQANSDSGAGTAGIAPQKIHVERSGDLSSYDTKIETLHTMLNIPIINLVNDDLPFSYYAGRAKDASGKYAIFSTKGTEDSPVWNSHPNEDGYLLYARYLAGRISQYFKH